MGGSTEALGAFEHVRTFRWVGGQYTMTPTTPALPTSEGIYAFVAQGDVKYIGAAKNLHKRLSSYLRRQNKPTSTRPVHGLLQMELGNGPVEVFVRVFKERTTLYEDLPVDLVLGVEAGLISKLNPPWNRRGVGRVVVMEVPTTRGANVTFANEVE
ncbi:MAG: GIY-YIG nuclease family protein [Mesorhizobium sp.]|uniref:GIY-YIG nuclease family protein n=1 Tax=Mesorhizobium sp. TaxID=1871066 RepID=UPI000FE65919|nr:GIY-YIG nuclease family protein [Mesorhizobium sp.]RWM05882.1 MAG: GIY-YIG nuclease family protein [Mesorhizobium sp.]TIO51451.1 MAG: GIY-YIG nuclease family protein [Mesorhizobium sp.]TIO59663.1 MAG: GIY-YIG nuclease family protein [Mesorhizobium sp.]TJV64897.1 MAG: GIY-YIG nuclease family protein [Mesorhizobium sp.]